VEVARLTATSYGGGGERHMKACGRPHQRTRAGRRCRRCKTAASAHRAGHPAVDRKRSPWQPSARAPSHVQLHVHLVPRGDAAHVWAIRPLTLQERPRHSETKNAAFFEEKENKKAKKNVADQKGSVSSARAYCHTRTSQTRDSSWCTLSAVSVRRDTTSVFRIGSAHAYVLVTKNRYFLKNTMTIKERNKSSDTHHSGPLGRRGPRDPPSSWRSGSASTERPSRSSICLSLSRRPIISVRTRSG